MLFPSTLPLLKFANACAPFLGSRAGGRSSWSGCDCDVGGRTSLNGGVDTRVYDEERGRINWDEITPNETLTYTPCAPAPDIPSSNNNNSSHLSLPYQCARLRVPLDWTAPDSDPRTLDIAILKLPATVPITSPCYGGPVLVNPGGPGGSGVGFVLRNGWALRSIVSAGPAEHESDDDGESSDESGTHPMPRHFDIVGFDPRGVNNTTPPLRCHPSAQAAKAYSLETRAHTVFGNGAAGRAAFDVFWAETRALASGCAERVGGNETEAGIGEVVSTAFVARDVIEIVEREGEWREGEARRLVAAEAAISAQASGIRAWWRRSRRPPEQQVASAHRDAIAVPPRLEHTPGAETLQYWGFSYGTVLGATLAATYPARIDRAVLDGVCDAPDYMARDGWTTNLQDADMQMVRFGEYCWLGGPDKCALYDEDGPAVIVGKFAGIISGLVERPLGVRAQGAEPAGVATYADLKRFLFRMSYNPVRHMHEVARVLKEVGEGNGTALVRAKNAEWRALLDTSASRRCADQGPYSEGCFEGDAENGQGYGAAISCSDAEDQTDITRDEYWAYVQRLMGQSSLLGDVWADIRVPCTAWKLRPKWRYEGNFTATTSHPLLFIGNTFDNVTPLRNAFKMSKGFSGSTVLHNMGEGHCSSASPSFCTMKLVRRYFQTGVLPKKGTVCRPARLPMDGFSEEEEPGLPEGETDEGLWRAMVHLNRDTG